MKKLRWMVVRGVVLWLVLPVGLLALAEAVLRMAGAGQSLDGVRAEATTHGTVLAPNPTYYQQFSALPLESILAWDHMDYALPARKPENEFRIVVLGESAAHGAPFNGYGFYRYLEVMLEAAFPEIRFVVINAACPGVNSHALRPLVGSTLALDPDLYLCYMGNNETTGTYGPATRLGRNPTLSRLGLVQAHIWLRGLRLTQVLPGSGGSTPANQEPIPFAWDWTAETEDRYVPPFRANLAAMCRTAVKAGVPVLLTTLAHNLERKTAPTPWNEAIRAVAARHDASRVALADVARVFEAAGEARKEGAEALFTGDVHFTPAGNDLLARALFPHAAHIAAARTGVATPGDRVELAPPREAIEARLGLSSALRNWIEDGVDAPGKADHAGEAEAMAIREGFEDALRACADPRTLREYAYWLLAANRLEEGRAMAHAWENAVPRLAGPQMLHARFLLFENEWPAVMEYCEEALARCPGYPGARELHHFAQDLARQHGAPHTE